MTVVVGLRAFAAQQAQAFLSLRLFFVPETTRTISWWAVTHARFTMLRERHSQHSKRLPARVSRVAQRGDHSSIIRARLRPDARRCRVADSRYGGEQIALPAKRRILVEQPRNFAIDPFDFAIQIDEDRLDRFLYWRRNDRRLKSIYFLGGVMV